MNKDLINLETLKKQYFLTSEILNLDMLANIKDIFYLKNLSRNKSFIQNLKIEKYEKKKIKIKDNKIFESIEQNWNKDPIDIKIFVEKLINNKYLLLELIKSSTDNIKISSRIISFINSNSNNILEKYNESYLYKNPINYEFLLDKIKKTTFDHHFYKKNNINIKYFENIEKIKINLDILLQGTYINYLLPSVGIIYPIVSFEKTNENPKSFIKLIETILDLDKITDKDYVISSNIPLISLDISEVLSNFLEKNNSNLFIKQRLDEIKINLDEIFFIKDKNNKNFSKNKIIKSEYIIPYKYDSSKKEIVEIERAERIISIENLFEINFKIVKHVLKNIYDGENKFEKLNNKNYKNVLASFLFNIIQILYDINKEYISKVSTIVIEVSDHYKNEYSNKNIKNTLDFISLLSKSLYKFKLILLNNFYHFFIPSKTFDNNYGIKKNKNNLLIPESAFLASNKDIFENYPFNINDDRIILRIDDGKNPTKLLKFILNISKKNDLYDKNEFLYFGGYFLNENILKNSISILAAIINSSFIEHNEIFLELIKIIEYNYLERKEFQIELINTIINNLSKIIKIPKIKIDNIDKTKTIIQMFSINYENSIVNLIDLINLNKKKNINNNDENKINKNNKKKDTLKLLSRLYMFRAMSIFYIVENNTVDIDFKNKMIIELEKKKKYFDDKILKIYKD